MCEWCGHEHPKEALCTKRPRWSRRGFLSCVGLGLVGLALPKPPLLDLNAVWDHVANASVEEWKAFRFVVSYRADTQLYLATRQLAADEAAPPGMVTTVWSTKKEDAMTAAVLNDILNGVGPVAHRGDRIAITEEYLEDCAIKAGYAHGPGTGE